MWNIANLVKTLPILAIVYLEYDTCSAWGSGVPRSVVANLLDSDVSEFEL